MTQVLYQSPLLVGQESGLPTKFAIHRRENRFFKRTAESVLSKHPGTYPASFWQWNVQIFVVIHSNNTPASKGIYHRDRVIQVKARCHRNSITARCLRQPTNKCRRWMLDATCYVGCICQSLEHLSNTRIHPQRTSGCWTRLKNLDGQIVNHLWIHSYLPVDSTFFIYTVGRIWILVPDHVITIDRQ